MRSHSERRSSFLEKNMHNLLRAARTAAYVLNSCCEFPRCKCITFATMVRVGFFGLLILFLFALSANGITTLSWLVNRELLAQTKCEKRFEKSNSCQAMCCLNKELKNQNSKSQDEKPVTTFVRGFDKFSFQHEKITFVITDIKVVQKFESHHDRFYFRAILSDIDRPPPF